MNTRRLARRTSAGAALALLALVGPQTVATGATGTLDQPTAPPADSPVAATQTLSPPPATPTATPTAGLTIAPPSAAPPAAPTATAKPTAAATARPAARPVSRPVSGPVSRPVSRPAAKRSGTLSARRAPARTARATAQRAPIGLLSRPQPRPPRSVSSPRVPVGFSPGFSIMEESLDDLRRDLDQMRALGVRRIRLDLSWGRVEGVKGNLDWQQPDRVFTEARKRGIQVLAVIGYQPDWAQRYDDAGRPLSVDREGFADFAAAAAKRYRSEVGAWEIWNEPNLQRFWIAPPDPAEYAALVNAVAPRIRAGDPGAPILVGSMSPANDVPDRSTVSPLTFLRGIYDRVPLRNFDAVSVHPYSYPAWPTGTEEWNTFFRMHQLRDIMTSAGDGRTRMWITEYGAPTGSAEGAVSPQDQATMVVAGIREARRRGYVGPMYLYSLRDTAVNPSDRESNFGLMTHDWRPKPAFDALRQEQRRTS